VHAALEERVTAPFEAVSVSHVTDMDPEVEEFLRELHNSLEKKHGAHARKRFTDRSSKKKRTEQVSNKSLFGFWKKKPTLSTDTASLSAAPLQAPTVSEVIQPPAQTDVTPQVSAMEESIDAPAPFPMQENLAPPVPKPAKKSGGGLFGSMRKMFAGARRKKPKQAVSDHAQDDTIVMRSDAPVAPEALASQKAEIIQRPAKIVAEEAPLALADPVTEASAPLLQTPEKPKRSLWSRLHLPTRKKAPPAPEPFASAPIMDTPVPKAAHPSFFSSLRARFGRSKKSQLKNQPTLSFDASTEMPQAPVGPAAAPADAELEDALTALTNPPTKQSKKTLPTAAQAMEELQWTEAARTKATSIPSPGKKSLEPAAQEASWASAEGQTIFESASPLKAAPKKRRGFFSQIGQAWRDRFGSKRRSASSEAVSAPPVGAATMQSDETAGAVEGSTATEVEDAAPQKSARRAKKSLRKKNSAEDAAEGALEEALPQGNVGKLITERDDVEPLGEDLTAAEEEVSKSLSSRIKNLRKVDDKTHKPLTTEAPKMSEKVKKRLEKSKAKASGFQEFLGALKYFGLGKERTNIIQNLSTMLNAGLPLIDSLHTLQKESRQKPIKKLLQKVIDAVENGSALWRALEAQHFFSPHAISLIRIGEEAGNLAKNLENLAMQEEKDAALKGKIKMAMIYPSIVLVMMFVIVVGLGLFVLPNLLGVLESLNAKLPLVTVLLVKFTNYFQAYAAILIPGMIGGMLFIFILAKFTRLKVFFQWFIFKIPGIGSLTRQATIARFGIILGSLLEAGVPLIEALNSLADVTPTVSYRKFYFRLVEHVNVGDSFSKSFESIRGSEKLLPVTVQQLVTTGERSGSLAKILLKIADIYEKKANETAERLPVILEPMILLFIGGLVGMIAFAIIVPIYSVVGSVGQQ